MGNIYDTDENKGTGTRRRELIASLAETRRRRGLSQAQLAERIGTERSNISRIESGAHNPTLDMILRIADALDVKFFAEDDLPPLMVAEDTSTVVYDVSGAIGKKGKIGWIEEDLGDVTIPYRREYYEYELRMYDRPLIGFSLQDYPGATETQSDVLIKIVWSDDEAHHLFPVELAEEVSSRNLFKWLDSRMIPKNRAFVEQILMSVGGVSPRHLKSIVDVSRALSLNDSYWVVPKGFSGSFAAYNLYENSFSRILSLVAYTGHSTSISRLGTSPELTTGGMFPKAWRFFKEDGIYLYKGGTEGFANSGLEPYSEYYAWQVAQRMEINAIPYDLVKWKGILASKCLLFTDIDTAFVPAGRKVRERSVKAILDYYETLGSDFYNAVCSMFVFDAVIFNTDRHAGNFGLLRENASGEFIAPAPLFDNGLSLFCYGMESDFKEFPEYEKTLYPYIEGTFDENAKLAMGKIQRRQLRKLMGFTFTRHPRHNLPEWRLEFLENFIRERAKYLLTMSE
jgi:transcriptional regulator with XRE-family HTH domain